MSQTPLKFEHQAMATVFELMIATHEQEMATSAAHTVFNRIDRLEQLCTRYLQTSEVAVISKLKPGETFRIAPELLELILTATEVCAVTAGCFDITVGSIMDLLHKVDNRWQALTREELQTVFATCGMNRLVIDTEQQLLTVTPDANGNATPVELDFGAIAKGYALDLAYEMLINEWEFENFLIHAGTSTVRVSGSMVPDKQGWPVEVGGEWRTRAGLETVTLRCGALSGSGFDVKGAHIIDVRNQCAAHGHAAAWAYAPTGALADALSTAALCMTQRAIRRTCAAVEDSGIMIVRKQPLWVDFLRPPVVRYGLFPA